MRTTVVRFVCFLLVLAVVPSVGLAQESKSAALVKEFTALLDQNKVEAIAAKDPAAPDAYVAALYFSGSQLLVVSARYAVPQILNERLAKKEYREIYTDLNSACVEGSKSLIIDIGADGLKPKKDESHTDTCDIGAKSYTFDGDWKKQKLGSEDEYTKTFQDVDEKYSKVLTILIAQAKKG